MDVTTVITIVSAIVSALCTLLAAGVAAWIKLSNSHFQQQQGESNRRFNSRLITAELETEKCHKQREQERQELLRLYQENTVMREVMPRQLVDGITAMTSKVDALVSATADQTSKVTDELYKQTSLLGVVSDKLGQWPPDPSVICKAEQTASRTS